MLIKNKNPTLDFTTETTPRILELYPKMIILVYPRVLKMNKWGPNKGRDLSKVSQGVHG